MPAGRIARLPPRFVEWCYVYTVGLGSAVAYVIQTLNDSEAAGAELEGHEQIQEQMQGSIEKLHDALAAAGQQEATRAGRSVVLMFGGGADVIVSSSLNAACLPGGYIAVHTELLRVLSSGTSVGFVVGHEVRACGGKVK